MKADKQIATYIPRVHLDTIEAVIRRFSDISQDQAERASVSLAASRGFVAQTMVGSDHGALCAGRRGRSDI